MAEGTPGFSQPTGRCFIAGMAAPLPFHAPNLPDEANPGRQPAAGKQHIGAVQQLWQPAGPNTTPPCLLQSLCWQGRSGTTAAVVLGDMQLDSGTGMVDLSTPLPFLCRSAHANSAHGHEGPGCLLSNSSCPGKCQWDVWTLLVCCSLG